MPRSDGLPNPADFVIVAIPNFYSLNYAETDRYALQEEYLREFTKGLHEELTAASVLLPVDEVPPVRYDFPPMAEGWAELFDLTVHIRPIIDDLMRGAFIGGAMWKAVARFKAWYRSRHPQNDAPIVLSSSMIELVCEHRTRNEYSIDGPVKLRSVTLSPWAMKPTAAGDSTAEWHVVWVQDPCGVTYQYITDASGEVLKHYILDNSSEGIKEATLSDDRLIHAVGSLQDVSYFSNDWNVLDILRECIAIADELGMADDKAWLVSELTNDFPKTYAGVKFQRFEYGTMVMLVDQDEPVYRVVTGLSNPVVVTIEDPPIDTSEGHRYWVQFYIGVPIEDLLSVLRAIPDDASGDTELVRMQIEKPPLPELDHLETLNVTVFLRDGREVVNGFVKRLQEFLQHSMAAALRDRAARLGSGT